MGRATRCALAVLTLTASVILGLFQAGQASGVPLPMPSVSIYAYDAPHHDQLATYTASERGPPVYALGPLARGGELDVDRRSHGASARPDVTAAHAHTTYDVPLVLAQFDQATGPTPIAVQLIDGDPSALESGLVAAKNGPLLSTSRPPWSAFGHPL